MKALNNPVEFLHGEENCFNLAFHVAENNPDLRMQAGVFFMFDHNLKYWDSIYLNHYWCITPEGKIVDETRHLWDKFAKKLNFKYQLPGNTDDIKILMITDSYKQLKLVTLLQSTDPQIINPFRHPLALGGADIVYLPGCFFKPEIVPAFIIERMKSPGYFTVEEALQYGTAKSN
jgi:hypothetical protein